MGKYYVPTEGPEDWERLLADTDKHWKTGYGAKALAYCWEQSGGFPPSVQRVFSQSGLKLFEHARFLLGLPEFQTPLPGRGLPSQSDIFVLSKSLGQLITITVEGKVAEGFGDTTEEWLAKGEPDKRNKETGLNGLCNLLELPFNSVGNIKYQLIHRTAAAFIEAQHFAASAAMMLVHSFCREYEGLEDYQAFLSLFGLSGAPNTVTFAGKKNGVELYLAWVNGEEKFLLE